MKKYIEYITLVVVSFTTIAISAQENTNVFKYKFGAAEICLLSEGQSTGRSNIFVGATPEMIQKCLPEGTFPNSCNAFLIRMSGKNILVDTGFGRNLFDNLKSFGVAPEQIDAVLMTHTHGDHIGGLLKDGQAAFPKAALYISKAENDFMAGNNAARNAIEAYKPRLHIFEPKEIDEQRVVRVATRRKMEVSEQKAIDVQSDEILPGIRAIAAYGHTPGHTAYMIESGSEKFLIWGDLTHAMAIQMPYPQVAMTYDTNTEMAIAYRKKVLEYVAANNIPVAGMHIAFPGIGKITKAADGGYIYTAVD
jgi:glyoxylase-like metal-dependent hydrolase (beta-lactamase superfamily II)